MLLINTPSNTTSVAAPVVIGMTAVAVASMRLLLPHCFSADIVVAVVTTTTVAYKRRALCILSTFTFYLYENDNNKNSNGNRDKKKRKVKREKIKQKMISDRKKCKKNVFTNIYNKNTGMNRFKCRGSVIQSDWLSVFMP